MANPRVSIVEYDATSSSDFEAEDGLGCFVLSSSQLSPPQLCVESEDGGKSDCGGDLEDREQPSIAVLSSQEEGEQEGEEEEEEEPEPARQCIVISSSQEDFTDQSTAEMEISADCLEPDPERAQADGDESWPATSTQPDLPAIPVESSSADDQPPAGKRARLDLSLSESDRPRGMPRKPYALRMDELGSGLRSLLADVRCFFTKPHSLQRSTPRVCDSTIDKAEERILCYLGFVVGRLRLEATPQVLLSQDLLEEYLDFLRDERNLTAATLANHVNSLLYPLKYIHRQQGPDYAGVAIIGQLRRLASQLQREGDVARPKTEEELRAAHRWLSWDEVLDAYRIQRDRFEVARGAREKAREAADLLLLALYTHIPPSRGLEMRTLEIKYASQLPTPFCASQYRERNIALIEADGSVTIHIQLYKTRRFGGHEQVQLKVETELCKLFTMYIKDFRQQLCSPDHQTDFLFVNSKGQPFSSSCFSKHVRAIFMKLTGCGVSVNVLRAAFVSWAYSQSECDDSLKDSLAVALRHSREQAQMTYDRRTANQKKAAAIAFTRKKAESAMEDQGNGSQEESDGGSQFQPGDFVALVQEGSTLQNPLVLVARIHALQQGGEASLLWYKPQSAGIYCLEVQGQWTEPIGALVAIKVKQAKGKKDAYRLCTSLRSVHKAVYGASRSS